MLPDGEKNKAAEAAKPVVTPKATTPSPTFETAAGTDSTAAGGNSKDNVFYLQYAVFIEGVEVPCSAANISYGSQGVPSCTITLPASKLLRELPQTTKIAIFFKDLVPTSKGVYEWRLLFDGEYMGNGYSVSANGASISLTFMHNAAHMHSMQLMTMDMSEYWLFGGTQYSAGGAVLVSNLGYNKPTKTILAGLLHTKNAPKYKSMADIVYTLVRTTLADVKNTPTGRYFKQKFGDSVKDNEGGFKLLRRFYGISTETQNMELPESGAVDADTGGSTSTGGSSVGSEKMNADQPRVEDQNFKPKADTFKEDKAKTIVDRANKLAQDNTSFDKEGCARAVNYMLTGDHTYPYSEGADVMATRIKAEGGELFTDFDSLKPGDIVFYQNTYGSWEKGTVTHVGVYVGNGEIVQQNTGGGGVTKTTIGVSNIAYYGRSYSKVK